MASSTDYIGHLGTFDKSREPFSSYTVRANKFFMTNNIMEISGEGEIVTETNKAICEPMKAILLMEIGPEVYGTHVNLLVPIKAKDVPFNDIMKKFEKHFNPKSLEIAESYKVDTRHQKQNETINE